MFNQRASLRSELPQPSHRKVGDMGQNKGGATFSAALFFPDTG